MAGLSLTAHCKTLTPMLSGGANPKENFELRAQSVKGALRFWWRAFHVYKTEADLFENESRLFGGKIRDSANPNGQKAVASSFRLNVSHDLDMRRILKPGRGGPFQNPNLGDTLPPEWGDGIRYFLFPVLHHRGKIHNAEKGGRPVVKEGLTFRIRVFVPDGNKDTLADVLRSLWLLMNFSGLGGRTRRGAGSFAVERFQPELSSLALPNLPDFDHGSRNSPAVYITDGIDAICNAWFHATGPLALPSYTAFRPGHSEIHVCAQPKANDCGRAKGALQAMEAIGRKMKAFRYVNPYEEAKQMHQALNNEGPSPPSFNVLEKAQMGLPIIYNFRDRGRFDTGGPPRIFQGYTAEGVVYDEYRKQPNKNAQENATRRASPLLISCHVFNGVPYAVISHFPAPILPKGQRIWLKSKRGIHDHYLKPPSGYDYVDALLRLGDKKMGRQAVLSGFQHYWNVCPRPKAKPSVPPQPPPPRPPRHIPSESVSSESSKVAPKASKPTAPSKVPKASPPKDHVPSALLREGASHVPSEVSPKPSGHAAPPQVPKASPPKESTASPPPEAPEAPNLKKESATPPPSEPPEDLEMKKEITSLLQNAKARADGLPWFLGEISGPLSGSGKKQKWPCHLWYLEEGSLKKDPDIWHVQAKQLKFAPGVGTSKGCLFLCTQQPDSRTPPSGQNYLYNVSKVN